MVVVRAPVYKHTFIQLRTQISTSTATKTIPFIYFLVSYYQFALLKLWFQVTKKLHSNLTK